VLLPSHLAPRISAMAKGLAETEKVERATGLHRRSTAALASVARASLGEEATQEFREVCRAANFHKHRPFIPTSRRRWEEFEDREDDALSGSQPLDGRASSIPSPRRGGDAGIVRDAVFRADAEVTPPATPDMVGPTLLPDACDFAPAGGDSSPVLAAAQRAGRGGIREYVLALEALVHSQNNTISILTGRLDFFFGNPAALAGGDWSPLHRVPNLGATKEPPISEDTVVRLDVLEAQAKKMADSFSSLASSLPAAVDSSIASRSHSLIAAAGEAASGAASEACLKNRDSFAAALTTLGDMFQRRLDDLGSRIKKQVDEAGAPHPPGPRVPQPDLLREAHPLHLRAALVDGARAAPLAAPPTPSSQASPATPSADATCATRTDHDGGEIVEQVHHRTQRPRDAGDLNTRDSLTPSEVAHLAGVERLLGKAVQNMDLRL